MRVKLFLMVLILCFLAPPFQAQDINRLEYFFDNDPGVGMGTEIDVTASDSIIDYIFPADASELPPGFHKLYVRAISSTGLYSLQEMRPFFILGEIEPYEAPELTTAEYYFNIDPGVGQANSITFTEEAINIDDILSITTSELAPGFHSLSFRVKDANGIWSQTQRRPLYIFATATGTESINVSAIEYFFDNDPGIAMGNQMNFTTTGLSINETLNIPLANGLDPGFHKLYIRVKDTVGYWSLSEGRPFYVNDSSIINAQEYLTKLEYFFDEDPGTGNGIMVPINPKDVEIDFSFDVDLTGRAIGNDTIYIRVINTRGATSEESYGVFVIEEENSTDNNDVAIIVSPNPADTYFTIKAPSVLKTVKLYNSQGILIRSYQPNQHNIYDVSGIYSGLYLLEIIYNNKHYMTKLIKN